MYKCVITVRLGSSFGVFMAIFTPPRMAWLSHCFVLAAVLFLWSKAASATIFNWSVNNSNPQIWPTASNWSPTGGPPGLNDAVELFDDGFNSIGLLQFLNQDFTVLYVSFN